jgi:hypothetical protein
LFRRGSSSWSPKGVSGGAPDLHLPRRAEVWPCEWPCDTFMSEASFQHEIAQFMANASLTNFLVDKCDQFQLLTNSFVQNFYFMPRLDTPMVRFDLYAQHFEMTFAEFCEICMIPSEGELREPRPDEFKDFLLTLTMGESRGVSKARVTSLHLPTVHYFGLFIGQCLTAKKEGGTLSALDMAILCCALFSDRTYSLGGIIARRLHINRTRGSIHSGIYATRLATHLNVAIRPDDRLLPRVYIDHQSMIVHHFIDDPEPPHYYRYNLVFSEVSREVISLPAPSLFDANAMNGYIIAYKNELAVAENEVQPWDARVPQPSQFLPGPDGFYGWP